MGLLPPIIAELKAEASQFHRELGKAQTEVEKLGKDGATAGERFKAGLGAGLLAAGAALTGVAAGLERLSGPVEQARSQLKTAIEDSGNTFADYQAQIAAVDGKMRNFAHSQSDTETALMNLTTATQDPSKALADMGLVADIAGKKHISLSDASALVVKALAGNAKVFKEFGISLDGAKAGSAALDEKMGELADRVKGQAGASVDTFGGKIDVLKTKLEDWVATHAGKLVPALTAMGPLMMGMGAAVQMAGTEMGGAALAAGPWLLAIAAVAAGAYLIITHWSEVSAFFKKLWDDVSSFFRKHEAIIAALAPFIGLPVIIVQKWGTIVGFFKKTWDDIASAVSTGWHNVLTFVEGIPGDIVNALGDVGSKFLDLGSQWIHSLWDGIKAAWNWLADKATFTLPKLHIWGVGDIGGGTISLLPHLAKGGTTLRDGFALVGENGPEVARLPAGTTVYPNGQVPADAVASSGPTVHQYFYGVTDFQALAVKAGREVGWALRATG